MLEEMMQSDLLLNKVLGTIRDYGLVDRGDRLVCAISGGPDSVCMVHILASLSSQLNLDLILAHVNYQTRGTDSDLDEKLCRQITSDLDLPIHVRSISHDELAMMKSSNFQREAREYRLRFFEELRREEHADKIALGHTADDVAETVLMHILRGSGIDGLSGIHPRSKRLIRPLIDSCKEDVIAYLDSRKLEYRIDKSNLESEYLRNRIRNRLMPDLKENYNSRIVPTLCRTAAIARHAQGFLESYVEAVESEIVSQSRLGKPLIDLGRYLDLKPAIRHELIRRAFRSLVGEERNGRSLDFELVANVDNLAGAAVGKRVDLANGIMVEMGDSAIILFNRDTDSPKPHAVNLPGMNNLKEFSLEISGELIDYDGRIDRSRDNWSAVIDADIASGPFKVRAPVEGDRIRLLNAPGSRKLSDIFTDRKIPRALRHEVPLFVAGDRIIWIIGVGVSHEARVTEETLKVLKLHAGPRVKQHDRS
jgi:tRNA(Ile)-lysidine synthase